MNLIKYQTSSEEKKLTRIIKDSKSRRSRHQLEHSKQGTGDGYPQSLELLSMKSGQTQLSGKNGVDQCIYTDASCHSRKQRRPSSSSRKQLSSKKSVINYIERNKKELETMKLRVEMQREALAKEKAELHMSPSLERRGPQDSHFRSIQSKVNSGLARSKSAVGRVRKPKLATKQPLKQDMTLEQRLDEDIKRQVTQDQTEGYQSIVNSRYAQLEQELQSNLVTRNDSTEIYSMSDKNHYRLQDYITTEEEFSLQSPSSLGISHHQKIHSVQDNVPTQQQSISKGKLQNFISKINQTPEETLMKSLTGKTPSKTRAQQASWQDSKKAKFARSSTSKSIVKAPAVLNEPQVIPKVSNKKQNIKSQSRSNSVLSPPKQDSSQQMKKTMPVIPKLNLNQSVLEGTMPSQSRSIMKAPSKTMLQSPLFSPLQNNPKVSFFEEPSVSQSSSKSYVPQFKLQSREEYLNFDIQNIWKEMEEMKRSKEASKDLFQAFQRNYYDRTSNEYFNQADCSPTKRLIKMKNAVTKHHSIQAHSGIKDDKYQIQYTTNPDKSYLVKPEEGQIDYDTYNPKHAQKFIDRVTGAQIERFKIKEDHTGSLQSKRTTERSPVRISSKKCSRGSASFVQKPAQVKAKDEDLYCVAESQEVTSQEGVVDCRMETEEYIESDDGYVVPQLEEEQPSQLNSSSLPVEARR